VEKGPARKPGGAAGEAPGRVDSGVERPSTWNPDLVVALQKLLLSGKAGERDFDRGLAALEGRYGEAVHSELIYLLCHLRFEPGEAASHWRGIVELRRSMGSRLDAPVDLRVALVSYFLEVHKRFENPTVIEMELFEQAREMAYRDELTGLHNFRYFKEFLSYEISRSDQYNFGVSLLLIDVDDFKSYNDHLGHQAGNEALRGIAAVIRRSMREVDLAARFGGEEFVVVAPETPKLGAGLLAQRICDRIELEDFPGEEGQRGGGLTVSLGVASYPVDAGGAEELVRRADRALYLAKSSGKNQVCLYGNNRRSYRRVSASIGGVLRYGAEQAAATTVDLSEGGARFVTGLSVPPGALVELGLKLEDGGPEIALVSRVVQSSARDEGGCEAAVRTLEICTVDRRRLVAALEKIADRG
jgi:diguanylate cyclase (GGDEF)-like protein